MMIQTDKETIALSELRGLGAKSAQQLQQIKIFTHADLQAIGAVEAFIALKKESIKQQTSQPSLNFLYALAGALSDRDWRDMAQNEKGRLLAELESAEAGYE